MCLGKKKKKKLIVFVSERHFEEKAENQKRQRTRLPGRAPRNSLREYAEPNFKPTAGELWLRFPTKEHEQRGSTMPVCHTFKHG